MGDHSKYKSIRKVSPILKTSKNILNKINMFSLLWSSSSWSSLLWKFFKKGFLFVVVLFVVVFVVVVCDVVVFALAAVVITMMIIIRQVFSITHRSYSRDATKNLYEFLFKCPYPNKRVHSFVT